MIKYLVVFFACCNLFFSQKLVTKFDEKVFYNIQIQFKDNSTESFEANKIKFKDRVDIATNGLVMNFNNLEYDNSNVSDITFYLKDKQNKIVEKNEIDVLTIENPETGVVDKYKNVDIYKFDKDLNLELEAKNILLPVRYEDNINLLGYRVYSESAGQKDYMNTFIYLNNANDNIAINPIDLRNLFNLDLISKRFVMAFKEVSKDCPEYFAQNENLVMEKVTKSQGKALTKEYINKKREIVKSSKNIPKQLRQEYVDTELENLFLLDNLKLLIDQYNKECK